MHCRPEKKKEVWVGYVLVVLVVIITPDEAVSGYYPRYWRPVRKGTRSPSAPLQSHLHLVIQRRSIPFSPSYTIFSAPVFGQRSKFTHSCAVPYWMSAGACVLSSMILGVSFFPLQMRNQEFELESIWPKKKKTQKTCTLTKYPRHITSALYLQTQLADVKTGIFKL